MVLYPLWNLVELQQFETETVLELIWGELGLPWNLGAGPELQSEVVSHLTPQEASLLRCGPQPEQEMGLAVLSVVQRGVLGFGPRQVQVQAQVNPVPAPGAGFLSGAGIPWLEFHWIPYEDAQVLSEVEKVMAVPGLLRAFGLSGVVQELPSLQLHSLLLLLLPQLCQ